MKLETINDLSVWVTHYTDSGNVYKICSDKNRESYTLYKNNKKTNYTNSDPTELYKYCK